MAALFLQVTIDQGVGSCDLTREVTARQLCAGMSGALFCLLSYTTGLVSAVRGPYYLGVGSKRLSLFSLSPLLDVQLKAQNRFNRLLRRERGTGRGSVVEDSHDGRDEVVFFFARRARGAAARREDVPQLLDRELAEGVARGPRRCRRRLDGRLRVDRGRFDDVGAESPLLAGGLGLGQPFLECFDRGRLLGLSVGGLVPRVFEAPLFFEGLSVVGGLVPRVFKAPLFFEAPPLDVRGLVTRGDGGVEAPLLLGLAPQERHGELEPGPAEGDVHGRYHARRRREHPADERVERLRAARARLRPQTENVVHDAVEERVDRRARAARPGACVVSRRRVGRRFVGRRVGRRHVVGERVGLVGRRRRRVGDRCGRDDRSAAAAPLAEEEAAGEDN